MRSPLAWCAVAVVVVVVIAFGEVPVAAQTRSLPEAPGTWKPWKPFAAIASARQAVSATPALVKAFEAELLELNAILRRAPAVATPVGFSVETWGNLAGYRASENAPGQPAAAAVPLPGGLTFGAFPIFEYQRNGKTIREDTGETALQQFIVNQIGPSLIDNRGVPDWGPLDADVFLQPRRRDDVAGWTRYGDALVIAHEGAALWVPLAYGAALDLEARARQAKVADFQESVDASTSRLAVIRDPAWRATRLKEAQQDAAAMPNPQAFVKQIEESIRIEEASLVAEVGPSSGSGKALAEAKLAVAEVTGLIAALSPAERAAPSCFSESGTSVRARFRGVPAAGCEPLVRPNYAYFNKALPRSVPQVVVITPIGRCFDTADKFNREANSPSPAGCRANRGLIETLDKAALRAWVR